MNRSDLITRMTERLGGDRTSAAAAVSVMLEEIEAAVARGDRVTLSGFGTFEQRTRAARMARNPRTGAAVRVDASVVPVFRAATGFKSLLHRPDGASEVPQQAAGSGDVPEGTGSGLLSVAPADGDGKETRKAEQAAEQDSTKASKKSKKSKKASKKAGKEASKKAGKEAGKAGKKTA